MVLIKYSPHPPTHTHTHTHRVKTLDARSLAVAISSFIKPTFLLDEPQPQFFGFIFLLNHFNSHTLFRKFLKFWTCGHEYLPYWAIMTCTRLTAVNIVATKIIIVSSWFSNISFPQRWILTTYRLLYICMRERDKITCVFVYRPTSDSLTLTKSSIYVVCWNLRLHRCLFSMLWFQHYKIILVNCLKIRSSKFDQCSC